MQRLVGVGKRRGEGGSSDGGDDGDSRMQQQTRSSESTFVYVNAPTHKTWKSIVRLESHSLDLSDTRSKPRQQDQHS